MKLVVSLTTRGRAQQLADTIRRNCACLSRPDTRLMVQIDDDDALTINTVVAKSQEFDSRVIFNVKPREDTIAAKWNRALSLDADVYTCLGDDDPLVSADTDAKILHAASLFPDTIGVVYGYLANASFSGVISFTKKWIDLLGYIQPEHFPYWFCDHWTDDIARLTGRIAFAEVRTDQKNAGMTQEMREPAWWATWFDACYMIRRREAAHIIGTLDEPQWRQELLYGHAPLIEFRSKWINDNVRAMSRQLENWQAMLVKDERYLRVKQKAIAAVPGILSTLPSEQEVRVYRELLTPPPFVMNIPQAYRAA